MKERDAALKRLGAVLGDRQDVLRSGGGVREAARRTLFEGTIPGLAPRRTALWLGAAAALTAVVALFVVGWPREARAPALVVMGARYAPVSDAELLRFGDGSEVTVKPGTVLSVLRVDARGASVVVERGSIFAAVARRPDARWSFNAGGFEVLVTGTAFDLGWDERELSIVMHEGSVEVTGPGIDTPRRVARGERAVFSAPSPDTTASAVPRPVERRAPESSAFVPEPAAAAESWQARAARGDHRGAFETVAPRLERELASLDAASLVRLATVARLGGHPDAARQVSLTIRARFPGSPSAAEAAFSLGTMVFTSNGAEAERWFRVALAESPGGGLAASARGRLLELAMRRGEARAAAEEYLRHHPEGPHAALARTALVP